MADNAKRNESSLKFPENDFMESFDDVINSPSQQFRVNLWRHEMKFSEYLEMARDCILDSIASVDGDLPDYQLAILRGVWETLYIMED